ncbi:putative inactive metalloprotease YmfF, partial [Dictyocoela roeselum]
MDKKHENQRLSRHELAEGVRLTCVSTDAFKTAAFSAAFVLPLGAENAPFALLRYLLYRGTEYCPNLTVLGETLDGLYGARVEPFVRKVGESLSIGFVAAGVDAGSVPAEEDPTGQIAHLLCDLMCRPCLENGRFRAAETESERQNLIDRIRALKNNPRTYAVRRTQEIMCKDEPFGACEYGSVEGVQALTPDLIWAAYQEVLQHARVE